MGGLKDHELMAKIRAGDFTFATNNAVDFRRRFRDEAVHPGLVILIPNATPSDQRALFLAALDFIGDRDLVNRVIEVDLRGATFVIREYEFRSVPVSELPTIYELACPNDETHGTSGTKIRIVQQTASHAAALAGLCRLRSCWAAASAR